MKTSKTSASPTGRVAIPQPEFQDLPGSFGARWQAAKLKKHQRNSMQGIAMHALDFSAAESRVLQRPND